MSFAKFLAALVVSIISPGCATLKEPPKTLDELIDSYGGASMKPTQTGAYRAIVWSAHNNGLFDRSESSSFKALCDASGAGATFQFGLQEMTCVDGGGNPIFEAISTVVSGNLSFIRGVIFEFYKDPEAIRNQQAEQWLAQQNGRTKALDELSYSSRETWMARELKK